MGWLWLLMATLTVTTELVACSGSASGWNIVKLQITRNTEFALPRVSQFVGLHVIQVV